jgi:hypothetical protein
VNFLVSILRWSKPLHHVKVNPLGEGVTIQSKSHVSARRESMNAP